MVVEGVVVVVVVVAGTNGMFEIYPGPSVPDGFRSA